MADKEQIAKLLEGAVAWNTWRKANPGILVDLSGADLSEAELNKAQLQEANLSEAHLTGADLSGAQLGSANLNKADLSGANLGKANLSGATLIKANFSGANLSEAHLRKTALSGANLSKANLSKANLSKADLSGADLNKANLSGADLSGADLSEAELNKAQLQKANLSEAHLTGADLSRADLRTARLVDADLSGADLSGALLGSANLSGANLNGADLSEAELTEADLSGADLRRVAVDSNTNLMGATVKGCKIDRYELELLGDNYGGLTKGDRMGMIIEDGVALLRSTYSGFLQWLHLFALAAFLFPYAWFVALHWSKAGFVPADETISLWRALSLFVFNGGVDWHLGWNFHWSFAAFLFLLAYNFLRGVLLWKTKTLELEQDARGLPAQFSLSKNSWRGTWGTCFQLGRWGLYFNFAAVAFNTWHFFTQRIPLPPG